MHRTEWFKRKFPSINDNGLLPAILERLSGTPLRLESLLHECREKDFEPVNDDTWSIKEEAGHLGDLEALWIGRLEDLTLHLPELRTADLTNRQTHEANHNAASAEDLVKRFSYLRKEFVKRLRAVSDEELLYSSLHPRLKTPQRIIDLAYFVAEHDDHHLAAIREKLRDFRLSD